MGIAVLFNSQGMPLTSQVGPAQQEVFSIKIRPDYGSEPALHLPVEPGDLIKKAAGLSGMQEYGTGMAGFCCP